MSLFSFHPPLYSFSVVFLPSPHQKRLGNKRFSIEREKIMLIDEAHIKKKIPVVKYWGIVTIHLAHIFIFRAELRGGAHSML